MGWHPFRDAKTRAEWRELLLLKQRGCCCSNSAAAAALCGHRFPPEGEPNESIAIQFAATFDHVVPRSQGGQDELSNFRLVHATCNLARGDGSGSKPVPTAPRVLRAKEPTSCPDA
jgi:5-methylcytosine-specific restriction endonuclease McrA